MLQPVGPANPFPKTVRQLPQWCEWPLAQLWVRKALRAAVPHTSPLLRALTQPVLLTLLVSLPLLASCDRILGYRIAGQGSGLFFPLHLAASWWTSIHCISHIPTTFPPFSGFFKNRRANLTSHGENKLNKHLQWPEQGKSLTDSHCDMKAQKPHLKSGLSQSSFSFLPFRFNRQTALDSRRISGCFITQI